MDAYYNEFDPFAAEWLGNLFPAAVIDQRSIVDVTAEDLIQYARCHFFAGIGGWELALRLAGWPANWPIDTGSCPCQGYSVAGKQKGNNDPRNLWPQWLRIIRKRRPECIVGEQVANAIGHGWIDGVFSDLEAEDYTGGAIVLGAHSEDSPHIRQRLYWVAYTSSAKRRWRAAVDAGLWQPLHSSDGRGIGGMANTNEQGSTGHPYPLLGQSPNGWLGNAEHAGLEIGDSTGAVDPRRPGTAIEPAGAWNRFDIVNCSDGKARRFEPGSFPLANGIPKDLGPVRARLEGMGHSPKAIKRMLRNPRSLLAMAGRNRVGRLRGYGNAIVPELAAAFLRTFFEIVVQR